MDGKAILGVGRNGLRINHKKHGSLWRCLWDTIDGAGKVVYVMCVLRVCWDVTS